MISSILSLLVSAMSVAVIGVLALMLALSVRPRRHRGR